MDPAPSCLAGREPPAPRPCRIANARMCGVPVPAGYIFANNTLEPACDPKCLLCSNRLATLATAAGSPCAGMGLPNATVVACTPACKAAVAAFAANATLAPISPACFAEYLDKMNPLGLIQHNVL